MILPTPDDSRGADGNGGRDPEAWVAADRFSDPISAELARARLEDAGIEARVFDAETGALGAYATGIGGVRLMVRAADLALARETLARNDSAGSEAPEVSDSDDILRAERYCSVCHSTDIEVGARGTPRDASLFMRLWDKVFGAQPVLRCRRCDHAWSE